jgi:ABC-type Fe3+ transport system permease subunit/sugar lactone lactonase YvrE
VGTAGAITWTIVGLCCLLPLAWIILQFVINPTTLRELHIDAFRAQLLSRTLIYNGAVAIVATLLALPAAIVLGRGRGLLAAILWFILPISLLLPSLTFAYGWKQFLRLLGIDPEPAGFFDVARCVWSLATWLWPVPAIVMGLSLRRIDTSIQQQALLDGAYWRITARQLIGAALASAAIVAALAMQEFAVYEPTGISVIATETRMVFETGAYSSPDNPITQPLGASASSMSLADQRARAAAAVATSLPMLAVVIVLGLLAARSVRSLSAADAIDVGAWPQALDAGALTILASWLLVAITLLIPIVALVLSLKRRFDASLVWAEFGPQVTGSILVASIAGAVAIVLALASSAHRSRGALLVSLISFLLGGQLIAIALIRLYNHRATTWFYESAGAVTMAYVARFGWIALLAAAATWTAPWRHLRDLAAVDGATKLATARYVVWPLAWPILGASALFIATLSLSEVPATVLLSPQRPQVLVPLLMTWVHTLRYDAMIEASLLMAGIVVVVGTVAALLWWYGVRMGKSQIAIHNSQKSSNSKSKSSKGRFGALSVLCSWSFFVICVLCVVSSALCGCDPIAEPEEIWLDTGTGPGQVVYPRGIAYSPQDDTFFLVDRAAHVQHLDRDGKFLNDWKMPLSQQGKPVGISVGPDGNVYIPDTHYHRVMVYSPQGEKLKEWGKKGTGPGEFIYPTDIAFTRSDEILVSEYGDNDRIQVFDHDGKYLREFGHFGGGPGEFSRPQSLLVDGDYLYVTDACNHRIDVFKTDGTFLRAMGEPGSEPGEFRFPYGLDMDKDGDLIVCEFGNNRVQKIDKQTGHCKATWGGAGREPGRLAYPWGVCVDKRGRIVAVDAGNNRLQVFQF